MIRKKGKKYNQPLRMNDLDCVEMGDEYPYPDGG